MIKIIKNIYKSKNKGFTLIELLVSISIISLMSGLVVFNYKGNNKKAELEMAAQKIASDIRRTQEYALSIKKFDANISDGGWGLRFSNQSGENDKYIIFADIDKSKKYRDSESEDYEIIELPKGVNIKSFDIDGNTSRRFAYVTFVQPNPDIFISGAQNENNDNLSPNSVDNIVLIIEDANNLEKKILINSFGLVEVL